MKLWVDAAAGPPDNGWVWAHSFDEAYHLLQTGVVLDASLGWDLGSTEWNGLDLASTMDYWMLSRSWVAPPILASHEPDPDRSAAIEAVLARVRVKAAAR